MKFAHFFKIKFKLD